MEEKTEWKKLDPAAKSVWRVKGILGFGFFWIFIGLSTLLGWYFTPASDPERYIPLWICLISTICILTVFVIYNIWIPMYFTRYSYALSNEGVLINRGIWWKYRRTIPYGRIQHTSIEQGPIEQIYGIYYVNSYTAGTGSMGGASAGSGSTGPEGQILGVRDPEYLRDEILRRVMNSRIGSGVTDIEQLEEKTTKEILEELKMIRKVLEKK
ncbi:MAG: PH domain-containing protein [Thermoplasmata archaeon]